MLYIHDKHLPSTGILTWRKSNLKPTRHTVDGNHKFGKHQFRLVVHQISRVYTSQRWFSRWISEPWYVQQPIWGSRRGATPRSLIATVPCLLMHDRYALGESSEAASWTGNSGVDWVDEPWNCWGVQTISHDASRGLVCYVTYIYHKYKPNVGINIPTIIHGWY